MNKKRVSTAAPLDKSGEPARTYFCAARGSQKIIPALNILQKTIYARSSAKKDAEKAAKKPHFCVRKRAKKEGQTVQKLTLGSLFDGIGGIAEHIRQVWHELKGDGSA